MTVRDHSEVTRIVDYQKLWAAATWRTIKRQEARARAVARIRFTEAEADAAERHQAQGAIVMAWIMFAGFWVWSFFCLT